MAEFEKYEKPTIVRNYQGRMNKLAGARQCRPCGDVSGIAVKDLVERFGSPLWVACEADLREKYRNFYRAFSVRYPRVIISYSYKTNFLPGICALFHQEGAWAEVVSGFEYDIALSLGVPGSRIIFNGPYKRKDELKRAAELGSKINADSYEEIYALEEIAAEIGRQINIGIRINMNLYEANWPRFGFNLESGDALRACRLTASSHRLSLTGIHIHIGTQILEKELYRSMAEKLAGFCKELAGECPTVKIEYLDVGGGYASKNTLHHQWIDGEYVCPTFEEYADAICIPLVDAFNTEQEMPVLFLEPGRALVDECIHMIATVISRKELKEGQRGLVLDAGINLLPTCYWYRFEIRPAEMSHDPSQGGLTEVVNLYGPLCMNIDCIQEKSILPPLRAGDHLVIRNVGAYNFSQSMQFIRLRPAVVMISGDSVEYLRMPETTDYAMELNRIPEHLLNKKHQKT
jgi:diaminopimelate decarboxylase